MKSISNQQKNKYALSAVKLAHTLSELKWLEQDEARFKVKHHIVTYLTGKAMPAVILYKTSAYTEKGQDKHGWNSDSFYKLQGECKANKQDVIIFIVEIKHSVIFWQKLSTLVKPVTINKENYPQGITVQKTVQEVYFSVQQFNVLSGIPFQVVQQIIEQQQEIDAENGTLFKQPNTPLLDLIYAAGNMGTVTFSTVKHANNKLVHIVSCKKGKKTVSTGFPAIKTDAEYIEKARRVLADTMDKNMYFLLPAGSYKDAAELVKEPQLTERLLLQKPDYYTVLEDAQAHQQKGQELLTATVQSNSKHRYTDKFISELKLIQDEN